METIETLSDQAIEDVSKASLTAEQFKNAAGPGVRAGIFVRDAWYSALKSYFSKQRVEQDFRSCREDGAGHRHDAEAIPRDH